MDAPVEKVSIDFREKFESDPVMIHSPGRVNLIGEHTDYNDGFVLPAAIDKRLILAMAPNNAGLIRLYASDMAKSNFQVNLNEKLEKSGIHWPDYILGVIDQLQKRGCIIGGFDCLFSGDIPIGAGLSSSAALEGGVLVGLNELFDLDISRIEMAKIGQQAENQFVGVQCGIMDQFSNQLGKDGRVIKLDCRSLDYSYHPFEHEGISILMMDTKVRRELASSEYNIRRNQCEEGVRILRKYNGEIKNLRDVTRDTLEKYKDELSRVVYKRCKYVLEENQRVLDACNYLSLNDIKSFGSLMYESHYGLRDFYEVSCRELDVLVEATENLDSVLGARMMGGGFGGCTINLVYENDMDFVTNRVKEYYQNKLGKNVEYYIAKIGKGATVLDPVGQK